MNKFLKNIPSKTPWSFVTNIAYFFPAIIFALKYTSLDWVVALSFISLALGSGYYHYWGNHNFSLPDWAAMFFVFSSLIVYGFNKLEPVSDMIATIIIAVLLFLMLKIYEFSEIRDFENIGFYQIGTLYSMLFFLTVFTPVVNFINAVCFNGFIALGFLIRQWGEKQKHFIPNGWIKYDISHGVWHILTAIGFSFYGF